MLLQNRYRLLHLLGSGGFAAVYLAEDRRLGGCYVAIKVLSSQYMALADYQMAVEMFRREATMLSRLDYPGIAKVSDCFSEGGQEYLVMEYVAGQTLEKVLGQVPLGQYIADTLVLEWLKQLCQVLDYLHSQSPPVVFRDLKPANIIVQPDNNLKLIDFGIARFFRPEQTHDTHILGTPGYTAPEQYGRGQSDARSDIYSLGVLVHQLLTGYDPTQTPLNLPPVSQFRPELSPHLAQVITKATQLNPAGRFQTITQFRQAIFNSTLSRRTNYMWIGFGLVILFVLGLLTTIWALQPQFEAYIPPALVVVVPSPSPLVVVDFPSPTVTQDASSTATQPPTPIPTATLSPPAPTATLSPPTQTPSATPIQVVVPAGHPYIVFVRRDRDTNDSGSINFNDNSVIYRVKLDGSNLVQLTEYDYKSASPAWSPDGRYIVFVSNRDGDNDIYTMTADGNNWQQLTNDPATDYGPCWSPDGQWIAFHSYRTGFSQLFLMAVDGSNVTQLTDVNFNLKYPVWSPDGQQIVFESFENPDRSQLYLINRDGSNMTPLTPTDQSSQGAAWSPDGQWLV